MPLSYCFGASVLHTHLYQGGGVVFDSRFMFLTRYCRPSLVSLYHIRGCPNRLQYSAQAFKFSFPSRCQAPGLLQAGGTLSPENIQALRQIAPKPNFFVMYGQTEATSRISFSRDRLAEKLGSAGVPLDNLAVRIVDDDGVELPMGGPVRSRYVAVRLSGIPG